MNDTLPPRFAFQQEARKPLAEVLLQQVGRAPAKLDKLGLSAYRTVQEHFLYAEEILPKDADPDRLLMLHDLYWALYGTLGLRERDVVLDYLPFDNKGEREALNEYLDALWNLQQAGGGISQERMLDYHNKCMAARHEEEALMRRRYPELFDIPKHKPLWTLLQPVAARLIEPLGYALSHKVRQMLVLDKPVDEEWSFTIDLGAETTPNYRGDGRRWDFSQFSVGFGISRPEVRDPRCPLSDEAGGIPLSFFSFYPLSRGHAKFESLYRAFYTEDEVIALAIIQSLMLGAIIDELEAALWKGVQTALEKGLSPT